MRIRALRLAAVVTLAAAASLAFAPADFLTLVGSLLTGNGRGVPALLAVVAGILAAIGWWRERRAPEAGGRRLMGGVTLAGVGLAGMLVGRQHAALSTETIEFLSDGDRLVGTITRPRGAAALPGLVLAQGSAPLPRRVYAPLAAALARLGFVVLNYDRRGVGASAGGERLDQDNNAGTPYLTQIGRDLAAAAAALRSQSGVLSRRVGLYGISQGGWAIPIAASLDSAIAFALIVSGPTTSIGEEHLFSDLSGEDDDHFARRLPSVPLVQINQAVDTATPQGFDPRPSLGTLNIPIRWMFGAWDNSIPVEKSARIVDSLARLGKPYRAMVFPEANHGLMIARGERAGLLPYWAPGVWDTTAAWLQALSSEP